MKTGYDIDRDIITVQLNVNGLQLYKSSQNVFWPILGRLIEPSSHVF